MGCKDYHAFIFLNQIKSDLALSCVVGEKSQISHFQETLLFCSLLCPNSRDSANSGRVLLSQLFGILFVFSHSSFGFEMPQLSTCQGRNYCPTWATRESASRSPNTSRNHVEREALSLLLPGTPNLVLLHHCPGNSSSPPKDVPSSYFPGMT